MNTLTDKTTTSHHNSDQALASLVRARFYRITAGATLRPVATGSRIDMDDAVSKLTAAKKSGRYDFEFLILSHNEILLVARDDLSRNGSGNYESQAASRSVDLLPASI